MCRMTSMGVRLKTSISGPGRWLVFYSRRFQTLTYMRIDTWIDWRDLPYGKPLYAIRVKARDWGVQA